MTVILLPSPGSPRYRFPCFKGTMKMCDSRSPSRRASLCFAWRYQTARLSFCSQRSRTHGRGPGVHNPVPITGVNTPGDDPGLPSSWRACCAYALFSDPGGTEPPGPTVIRRGPRDVQDEGSPRVFQISGLNRTALTLAVYASQWLSPAPTQDSLPAAGLALPGGIGYPQGSNERFRYYIIPLSQTFLAQGHSRILLVINSSWP